jgi:hypothetical protein
VEELYFSGTGYATSVRGSKKPTDSFSGGSRMILTGRNRGGT